MAQGSRPGERRGGRQKGTPNKLTAARIERMNEAAKALEATLPHAFTGDAHAFLMAVYKDESLPLEVRLDAAKAAIPYERPRLQAIAHSGIDALPRVRAEDLSDDELAAIIRNGTSAPAPMY